MEKRILSDHLIEAYNSWLYQNEKSRGTIQKYNYYLRQLQKYADGQEITKELLLQWKGILKTELSSCTVNGALAAINGFLHFAEWDHCAVKLLKVPRQVFCAKRRELSKEEYQRLIEAAEQMGNTRMALLLQTVCSTGIRISELSYITVEVLERQYAEVDCKGKIRKIFLTDRLCRMLKAYAEQKHITEGMIFITRTGKAMDRSNIWREMKKIGACAGVAQEKVFPHNLRHLFARVYYSQEKDLLRLSDVLGHSSINTTRIYTMESGENHIRQLEKLDLLAGDYYRIPLLL